LSDTEAQLTSYSGKITANEATSMDIDAKGKLENVTIDASSLESLKINSESESAISSLNTGNLLNLDITSSDDLTISGGDLNNVESANIVVNSGIFDSGNTSMLNMSEFNISGSDETSKAILGTLGESRKDHNIDVKATGLQSGLKIGAIDAGVGRDVNIDVSGVTGDINIGNIGSEDGAENITFNSSGALGSVTLGSITSAEDVNLDLSESLGDINIGGSITGDNVNIDVSDSLKDVSFAGNGKDVVLGSSLSYTGSSIVRSELDISVSATEDTDIKVDLTSGVKDDEFTIDDDGTSNAINLTLTGDLGNSETSIDLNSISADTTAEDLKKGDLVGINFDNGADHEVDVSAVKNTTVGIDLGCWR